MTVESSARVGAHEGLAPLSLAQTPAFIERQFPVGRLSAEAYKERKAVAGQTLTALGSYWKGRKPLILVRAVVLGTLLPSGSDPAADLDIFLKLMAMDDAAFARRFHGTASAFAKLFPDHAAWLTEESGRRVIWRSDLSEEDRALRMTEAFSGMPYPERLQHVLRPEECNEHELLAPVWSTVNQHLGTRARSIPELVEQLGIARFGHNPILSDTFCGGGSIPFEAARIGCDVYASDLNPIACMLTWGALNLLTKKESERSKLEETLERVSKKVDAELTQLGIEHDSNGNRAKAFLYCLETICPRTGWLVPMVPTWVISEPRRVIGKMIPNPISKTYEIDIIENCSDIDFAEAKEGTIRNGHLVHPMNPERSGVAVSVIRGDVRGIHERKNGLRPWNAGDFKAQDGDIFGERLYCIEWYRRDARRTVFSKPTQEDFEREYKANTIVSENLSSWQDKGLVSADSIVSGKENEGPIRTNGWTHWHHLFVPRALITAALIKNELGAEPAVALSVARYIDNNSKGCRWKPSQSGAISTFDSQALKTHFNWGYRTLSATPWRIKAKAIKLGSKVHEVGCFDARLVNTDTDVFVTDPPYADAVRYEEITEFFIAWLRKNPPPPFDQWTWDSRRNLAIKGRDEQFRRDMVEAYGAMTARMSDCGSQVVMFTHQDAGVWADLGAILWAAGLKVTAAWNIVTETESALKEGNYVQGTVCLVLRKRLGQANGRRMEIEAEIEEAVADQLARLTALDDSWHERTSAETLYTDGDLTLAAYAAALQVVTAYSTIDRQPLDRDLYRPLARGETTMLRELVDYAARVANNLLVPEGFPRDMWRDLIASERFYVRMLDMEAKGAAKVADFQNFAKSFAYGGYTEVMASTAANAAALAGAADLKGRMLGTEGFGATLMRQVLFAVWKTMEGAERDPKRGVTILKADIGADYWTTRQKLILLAGYVAQKTAQTRPEESAAAAELTEALKLDRV